MPTCAEPSETLTLRQLKVVELIAAGHTTRSIARALGISPLTARKHRENILTSLSLGSAAALAAYAARASSTPPCAHREDLAGTGLTRRETEVGLHLVKGMTNKQVGRRLGISDLTVRKHRENIYRKLSVTNIHELMLALPRRETGTYEAGSPLA